MKKNSRQALITAELYLKKYKNILGKFTKREIERKVGKMPLTRSEKEYVKQVFGGYDYPSSKGVTKEEYKKGMEEMKKNTRDSINDRKLKIIERHLKK